MQRAANRAVQDGLHSHDRRHGWRDKLANVLRDHLGDLDTYRSEDWRSTPVVGEYLMALVLGVNGGGATLKLSLIHI